MSAPGPGDTERHTGGAARGSEYRREYDDGVEAITNHGSGNITYNHRNRSCIDLENPEEQIRFFGEFTMDGLPVYIFAVTNNEGDFNEATRDTYVSMRMAGNEVMLGQWTSPGRITCRDVIRIVSGITQEQALKYKKQYDQQMIVMITRNGYYLI